MKVDEINSLSQADDDNEADSSSDEDDDDEKSDDEESKDSVLLLEKLYHDVLIVVVQDSVEHGWDCAQLLDATTFRLRQFRHAMKILSSLFLYTYLSQLKQE